MRASFDSLGMDTSCLYLAQQGISSGVASITVDSKGENHIIVVAGANHELTEDEVEAAGEVIQQSKVLVCQNEIPLSVTLAALKKGKAAGVLTLFNAAPVPKKVPEALYAATDYLCVNEVELAALSGLPTESAEERKRAAQVLLKLGVRTVLVTLGPQGCFALSKTQELIVPGVQLKASQVVDTVGAGDCFTGSLAYFLADQVPLAEALQRANFVAALSVQKKGAQASYPSREDILHLYPEMFAGKKS
eukprot:gb/GEZN01014762.1/.p1 GENE.gb/GEZN01014762.1/~~gb/GEZN01014762.1/.p1  ORF type:complete len:286 (-),score=60.96 gb/GEZN01014762.1/:76-819(-)